MKKVILAIAAVSTLGFAAGACSQQQSKDAESDMSMESATSVAGPIRSVGTVIAVDAAAGSITLDHEPIEALRWPSMKMKFKADRADMLGGIAVGDRVAFEVKSASDPQTVTMVQKQ